MGSPAPRSNPTHKIVVVDNSGNFDKGRVTVCAETFVNTLNSHILDSVDKSAIKDNPLADSISVNSALKHTMLKGLMTVISPQVERIVPIGLKSLH